MRFLENGPNIPDELLNAHDEGRVVLFCGAGVSQGYAGLPNFSGLATKVLTSLGSIDGSEERRVFDLMKKLEDDNYLSGIVPADRIFTMLGKNFHQRSIEEHVARALRKDGRPSLKAHKTLLKLARPMAGGMRLVTTNFDRLFELCDPNINSVTRSRLPRVSHDAGDWGIVHLHGRVNSDYSGADHDGFVLNRAEFGEAYLASGWARDFFREVIENYKAVFIGYSADDPPVSYLLEGLRHTGRDSSQVFAFQSSDDESDAIARWDDKCVTAIPYQATDSHHSALYSSLDAWAKRAADPAAWRKKAFAMARKGPERLSPHQRGMLAHIVKTTPGALAFSRLEKPLPPEWLCVFDPQVRLAPPSKELMIYAKPGVESETVEPAKLYGLDDDPAPAGRNERYSRKDIPPDAWDAFSFNADDRRQLNEFHIASLRDRYAGEIPQLSRRLSALAEWICRVADKPATAWWAGNQSAIHPQIRTGIENLFWGGRKQIRKPIRDAWRLIFELEDTPRHQAAETYHFEDTVKSGGWTADVMRQYGRVYAPRLERRQSFRLVKPPKLQDRYRANDLVNLDVVYPEHFDGLEVPAKKLPTVIRYYRRNLETALDLELDISFWTNVSPIERDNVAGNAKSSGSAMPVRSDDLSGYTQGFADMFRQLVASDTVAARREFLSWRVDDVIFQRLRFWAAAMPEIATPEEFAAEILSLPLQTFWEYRARPDLLLALAKRWPDLSSKNQKQIERKILRGPRRFQSEEEHDFLERSAHTRLNMLHWLDARGCRLSLDLDAVTELLKKSAPNWSITHAHGAAEGSEPSSGWVQTDSDPSLLLDAPVRQIIPLADKESGRGADRFVERAPFQGLVSLKPVKAFKALVVSNPQAEFQRNYWDTFLLDDQRKDDPIRLKRQIAERLCELRDADLASMILTLSRWFKEAAGSDIREKSPDSFDRIWSKFIAVSIAESIDGDSALLTKGDDRDWAGAAINAPAGNLAQLLMSDPVTQDRKKGAGLPKDWAEKANALLGLPGDSRRYALVIFACNLRWFFRVDPKWTETTFLTVLENGDDNADVEAIWAGFFWGASVPQKSLFIRMKPLFLKVAREQSSRRKRHGEILSGIILSGWGNQENGERFISSDEYRAALLDADEDFRRHTLWQLGKWSGDSNWQDQIVEFLQKVWPRQKKARTPVISARLVDLAIKQTANFPEVVNAVVPLLGASDTQTLAIHRLRSPDSAIMEAHPEATLDLIHAMLSEDARQWPYGAQGILADLRKAAPHLVGHPKLIELQSRLESV